MRKIRLACLTLTLSLLAVFPQSAAAATCCPIFNGFCDNLCATHQGTFNTDCNVGMSHSDYCWCIDDTGTPIYGEPSGKCGA